MTLAISDNRLLSSPFEVFHIPKHQGKVLFNSTLMQAFIRFNKQIIRNE